MTNGSTGFGKWGLTWSFDRYGNRLNQTVTAGTAPSNSLSFAYPAGAQTNQPDGICFDAAGNLLSKTVKPCPSPNSTYDAENRMVTYSYLGSTGAYTYDGNDLRVKKVANGTTTVFVYADGQDIAEYDNGAAPTAPSREFIYSGSELLASVIASKTIYHHKDHLSVRLFTDGTPGSPTYGQATAQQGTYPYGESWYSTGTGAPDQFVFTTYERDSESGLDYAIARFYDSGMGRFCSADPVYGFAEDPQSWNRYAYVRNDPINMSDPSGQSWLTALVQILIDIFAFASGNPELAGVSLGNMIPAAVLEADFLATQKLEQSDQKGQVTTPPPMSPPLPPPTGSQTARLNCIQKALNAQFPTAHFKRVPNTPTQTVGGHINGTFSSDDIPTTQAQDIQKDIRGKNATRLFGIDKGTRYPGGLHLPSGDAPINQSPTTPDLSNVSVTGHVDRYNPRSGLGGTIGHVVVDYGLGHIVQIFGKNLDKRCM